MRIVLGEDSALFREALASLLADAGHDIVAKAPDAPTLVNAVDAHQPDLAIVDIRMPPDRTDDGARAARALRQRHPQLGILLLSQHIEVQHSVELVSTGGFGYLLKDRVSTSRTFSTLCAASPRAARLSTPKSWHACWAPTRPAGRCNP